MTIPMTLTSHDQLGDADMNASGESTRQRSSKIPGYVRSEDIAFDAFASFPAKAQPAKIVSISAKPGPYGIRVKVVDGVRLMPHTRIYSVISGVFYVGFGSFEANELKALPSRFVVLPGNTSHFHSAMSGEYVTPVNGVSPLGIE